MTDGARRKKLASTANLDKILSLLERGYPRGQRPWASRADPFWTLIATILSAQTTDGQVDRVTPALFKRYPTPARLGSARRADVERIIKSVGLFKAKARNIIAASAMIVDRFDGAVPKAREKLVLLPGVGRKTANVVLIKAFGMPAMPVDTHVFRVAKRIGLSDGTTPAKVEEDLVRIIPRRRLGAAHFWMIHHGRTLCSARAPQCPRCPLAKLCNHARQAKRGQE